MSVTSNRSITVQFTGDVEFSQPFSASTSATSPGVNTTQDLTSGNNTINLPDGAIGVTIIKPVDNTVNMWAKGSAGDDGIPISLTDPDSFSLANTTGLVIETDGDITLRFIFS